MHPVHTKHLYNICTMLGQRRRRWTDVVQMLYKCFVFSEHMIWTLMRSRSPAWYSGFNFNSSTPPLTWSPSHIKKGETIILVFLWKPSQALYTKALHAPFSAVGSRFLQTRRNIYKLAKITHLIQSSFILSVLADRCSWSNYSEPSLGDSVT